MDGVPCKQHAYQVSTSFLLTILNIYKVAKQTQIEITHCYLSEDNKYACITYNRNGVAAGKAFPRKEFEAFLAIENELDWMGHKNVLGIEEWFKESSEDHRKRIALVFIERNRTRSIPAKVAMSLNPLGWLRDLARPVPKEVDEACSVKDFSYDHTGEIITVTCKAMGVVAIEEIEVADFGQWLASKGYNIKEWYRATTISFSQKCRTLYNYLCDLHEYQEQNY
jgi:hypothetical protein